MGSSIDFVPANNARSKAVKGPIITKDDLGNKTGHIGGNGHRTPVVLSFLYDFAALGGAVGTITLTDEAGDAAVIPDNFVVTNAWYEQLTLVASGGTPTIDLGVTGNTDLFNDEADVAGPYATAAGIITAVADELPAKMSADASVLLTVGTAALTAGKFLLHVQGVYSV